MDFTTPTSSPREQGQQAGPPLAPMRENLVARPIHGGNPGGLATLLNIQAPVNNFSPMGPASQQP